MIPLKVRVLERRGQRTESTSRQQSTVDNRRLRTRVAQTPLHQLCVKAQAQMMKARMRANLMTSTHNPEPPRPESPDSAASNDISWCLAEGSVQRSCAAPPGPDDISQSRADGPVQPVLKVFPKTQHGNRKRAFIETWYVA
ncbi:zinc finger MYM-type 1-like protein [Labeo rohita]|uniref:Zinc finger MYM-type 1-like protein n=1 Tax=Labeo rohita TaxID=84645 RepID=A0A498M4L9_LABRO|nr:zinc finger MYM-type 1-like protein [Labeo rohita]RXN12257.1 zinc finger MYM-type 1-like protein [Labeo rohita]